MSILRRLRRKYKARRYQMIKVDTGGPSAVETVPQSGEMIQAPNCMTERIEHLEEMFCSPVQAYVKF